MCNREKGDAQPTIIGRTSLSDSLDIIIATDDRGRIAIWTEMRGDHPAPEGLMLEARQASGIATLLWRAAQQAARSHVAGGA